MTYFSRYWKCFINYASLIRQDELEEDEGDTSDEEELVFNALR